MNHVASPCRPPCLCRPKAILDCFWRNAGWGDISLGQPLNRQTLSFVGGVMIIDAVLALLETLGPVIRGLDPRLHLTSGCFITFQSLTLLSLPSSGPWETHQPWIFLG